MTTHTGMEFWLGCSPAELLDFADDVAALRPTGENE